ncbi:MAG: tRNA (N6-threonylcarbamoyladenosine(37)-N6)-methyltransferase TrmO [Psychrobacter sp.]|jgi:tRNA-Thr(GGU) m(6)t(6)A37 methyltransferase TsaA|uniref:tRNA (N6-threonylcarbamoyladenosine(37)-N6)-methyltransferase TrmO n=1 Tax=Psychrobacter namhaensis TaxID=292734 RepID=A0ABW8L8W9_9GAMM|nr:MULTISPECIES: tRNA (N6-threonylcarbamoyladenosine(37)-N6)-methyltransferase TrmO [Psychrobacter]MCD1279365.1 tRNA (N6-threonylcarbamoyladenosine(37)-N6)-methyltransferase TrmO [Psychrobacter sp. CCUG 69069]MCD6251729.1 tRNA (N6-threonylcarbamoyladenosine(37)-N6)-methyltransferase TrmO [Psychrobacter sp.]HCN18369.1 tRNA (N6-threonylcarbamoyladenosine(37)-N6)-methyltransferase TrmO [Psychrobacter sp.]|tara:strand:- start:3392 stop:4240 length:849 start_codon:yes stop_codon:yes gene_type:complete
MWGEKVSQDESHRAPIIGYHRAPLSQKFGAPRQPNLVALTSVIEMRAPYDTPAAFVGLEAFSHIWVSWQFHHNYLDKGNGLHKADREFRPQVRPPRLGGNQKIGVFASRSMYRPSALGLSVVKLERVAVVQGRALLIISGADMINDTPIIDIKPYVAYSDAIAQAESGFAPTAPVSSEVTITESAYAQFITLVHTGESGRGDNKPTDTEPATVAALLYKIQNQLSLSDIDAIKALIAQDPRPAYRRHELKMPFIMRYKSVDVSFQLLESGQLQISSVVAVSL